MKYLLFTIFGFFMQFSIAQTTPRTITHNGKSYFVYPYHFTYSTNYYYGDAYVNGTNPNERDIIPYPTSLPDGDYLMYFEPYDVYHKKMWFFHRRGEYRKDSTRIAVTFSLKNNSKVGAAVFYDGYNRIVETGTYVNNQKEGEWKKKSYFYTYRLSTDYFKDTDKFTSGTSVEYLNYKNGLVDGKYLTYMHPDELYFEIDADTNTLFRIVYGNYKENQANGEWRYYYKNKQLFKKFNLIDTVLSVDPFLTNANNAKLGPKLQGWQETYFFNGKLYNRKFYNAGISTQLDTGYFDNGKFNWVNSVEIKKQDTSELKYHNYYFYDSLGNLEQHSFFMNDVKQFHKYYYEGKLCSEEISPFYYYDIKNKDTLVATFITYGCYSKNPTQIESITFQHLETGASLHRDFTDYYEGSTEDMNDFSMKSDTASDIYYFIENDYRGENKKMEFRTYRHYYKDKIYNTDNYINYLDSTVLFLDGKRFTGKYIEYEGRWNKRTGKIKDNEHKIKYFTQAYGRRGYWTGTPSFGYSSKRFYDPGWRRRRRFSIRRKLSNTTYGYYSNGLMEGEWINQTGKHGKINSSFNYQHGLRHGVSKEFEKEKVDRWSECVEIKDKSKVKKTGLFRKGRYYLSVVENFSNGDYNGEQIEYYCSGQISDRYFYKDGYLEGDYETFREDGRLIKKTSYSHGYLNGKFNEWSPNNKMRYDTNFEEGIPVGEFKTFYYNGNPNLSGNLNNGFRIGDWFTYFEEGVVKYKEIYDLNDSSYFNVNSLLGISGVRWHHNYDQTKTTCYSMQYYPSSQLASEGKILKNVRTALWKFYDEGGNRITEINYEPGFIAQKDPQTNKDTIYHFGNYKSFYSNGQKMAEAFVLNETSSYNCYQEVNIAVQDLYYINYWDKEGNQTVQDKNGKIKTIHLTTGKPESEGEILNGLRNGYWRYYDPEGKLNSVGNYNNGVKEGRWLSGDLDGMHYLDDACFDISNPKVIEEMEWKKKKLFITEIIYKNGEILKTVNFSVDLNK